jgi:hypothetical protein
MTNVVLEKSENKAELALRCLGLVRDIAHRGAYSRDEALVEYIIESLSRAFDVDEVGGLKEMADFLLRVDESAEAMLSDD